MLSSWMLAVYLIILYLCQLINLDKTRRFMPAIQDSYYLIRNITYHVQIDIKKWVYNHKEDNSIPRIKNRCPFCQSSNKINLMWLLTIFCYYYLYDIYVFIFCLLSIYSNGVNETNHRDQHKLLFTLHSEYGKSINMDNSQKIWKPCYE